METHPRAWGKLVQQRGLPLRRHHRRDQLCLQRAGGKDSVLVSPDDYRRLLKGGGTIDRWR